MGRINETLLYSKVNTFENEILLIYIWIKVAPDLNVNTGITVGILSNCLKVFKYFNQFLRLKLLVRYEALGM